MPFHDGFFIPYEGKMPHRLVFGGPRTRKEQRGQRVVSRQVDRRLTMTECRFYTPCIFSGHTDHAPRRLKDWLKKQAKQKITIAQLDVHAERNWSLSYTRLGVRDQTTRWGSCSSNKTLSFSWRLIHGTGTCCLIMWRLMKWLIYVK